MDTPKPPTYWNVDTKQHEIAPRVDAFLTELHALCKSHNIIITNASFQSGFILREYAAGYTRDLIDRPYIAGTLASFGHNEIAAACRDVLALRGDLYPRYDTDALIYFYAKAYRGQLNVNDVRIAFSLFVDMLDSNEWLINYTEFPRGLTLTIHLPSTAAP